MNPESIRLNIFEELTKAGDVAYNLVRDKFGERPGIYKLRVLQKDGNGYVSLSRLLGSDPEGLLYIGMSEKVITRFGGLRAGVWSAYNFTDQRGHTFVNEGTHDLRRKMTEKFIQKFKDQPIEVEVLGFLSDDEVPPEFSIKAHEGQLIRDYTETFGEPPPFNNTGA
jgi:hypothetical protein